MIFRSEKICDRVLTAHLTKIQYDCTFETAPIGFAQVMNLLGTYRGAKFPVWTCVLTSKKAPLYTAILKRFQEEYPSVVPKLIQCDFEAGLTLAARLVYPLSSIRGCWQHFSGANFKQFKKRGLLPYMQSDAKVRRILRKIMTLPILPASKICEQIDRLYHISLKQVMDPEAHVLLVNFFEEYLIPFWVKKIGPSRLSVFGCPDKTNNATEILHSQMHFNLPHHAKIFTFGHHLQRNIFESYERKIGQLDNGKRISFYHQKSQELQE